MRLGNLINVQTGKLDANAATENGIYPFFTCGQNTLLIDKYAYDCECVLIAGNGDLNVKYYNGKFNAYQRTYIITSKDKTKLLPKFLYYFFDSYINILRSQTVGGVIKYIKLENLTEINIFVPDITIQYKIINIFDNLNNAITSKKEQINAYDELVKSRFIELFGDQETNPYNLDVGKLSDVADIYLGLTHTPTYVEQGKPFLSVRDISSGMIDFSNCHYITEEEFCSLPNGARPKVGDMLFCRVGTIGKPVIIPENTPEFGTFVSVGYLRKKANVNNYYLKSWMENDYFMRQVYDNVAGASQINLNTGWLKNFRILIPSMKLQEQFAAFVEQTDKSKLATTETLKYLEELKASLMQKYFGEETEDEI